MLLSEFITYLSLEKKFSKHTVTAYEADLRSFVVFFEKTYEDADISKAHYVQIRSWIVSLVEEGKSNRTINRKVSSLTAYYKFLLKIGCVQKSPLLGHKSLKASKVNQVPFSQVEMSEVLEMLRQSQGFKAFRDRLIVELLYATGMRRIELVQLRLEDVDVLNKQVKVLGKRNKERLVPLIPSVLETLVLYLEERKQVVCGVDDGFLLLTEKGVKIYEMLVYRVINHYFSEVSSKIKKSPHIVRHSFATHLLSEGADLNAVKELLGHSSLAATQVYTHQNIAQLAKIHEQTHPRNAKKERH